MFLRRRLLSTTAAAARGPPPIRVDVTESAGRGVFATRPVSAGELLHSAQPLVCHPSPSLLHEVCYSCLRRKPGEGRASSGGYHFCSDACRENAKGSHDVEKNADWSSFDDHCSSRRLKYPYMAKRLACMVISGAANADSLNILQPARLHQGTLIEMEEEFELLESTFKKAGFQEEVTTYPNTHIVWLENADAKLKALRDIEEGEELHICYIDTSMDVNARQKILADGFGFECHCLRCLSGD
ncbi:Histone-lysine N-methyltransferase ATXR4 [Dichanthelium oligosanthes]|uniref:Histone-lysine N-methyltransferase ATXR4 n=1 Tax=Dichanthelium oligosanthes TaxID=888268 RepID=A0A1E5V4V4_9POAL|nr:Histone-lysine N-methyltransferase ATXR4 [Dichanthelium oligosanthes]